VVESKDVAATGGKLAAGVARATIDALVGGS
jgi:peptidoglycan glycosyltransferase